MNSPQPLSPINHIEKNVSEGSHGQILLKDVSLTTRYGLKGPNAADWLANMGIPVPLSPNSWLALPTGGRILRLGLTEFLVEGDAALVQSLYAQPRAYGVYPVLRQDAALTLSGSHLQDLLRQICSVNLSRLADSNMVVLTSMAGVGAIVLAEQQFDEIVFCLWFDGTYGNYLWDTFSQIAIELNENSAMRSQLS